MPGEIWPMGIEFDTYVVFQMGSFEHFAEDLFCCLEIVWLLVAWTRVLYN